MSVRSWLRRQRTCETYSSIHIDTTTPPPKLDHLPFVERLRIAPEEQRKHRTSTCERCNLPWAVVHEMSVRYTEGYGMFALCQSCWDELGTAEARTPYYVALTRRYYRDNPNTESLVIAAIRALSECDVSDEQDDWIGLNERDKAISLLYGAAAHFRLSADEASWEKAIAFAESFEEATS